MHQKAGIKYYIRQLIPPALYTLITRHRANDWTGNYANWQQAKKECSGYDSDQIFEKVKEAARKVWNGEASFERDSVLFYEDEFNWPLMSSLLLAAAANKGHLHVADFGGSMASTYFQHKKILSRLPSVHWGVIEQPHFVDFGKKNCHSDNVSFFYDINEYLANHKPQVLVLSSVLQYLENPWTTIDSLLKYKFPYIIVDRTAFINGESDRLTLQQVPASIYKASYPAWFFNENRFLAPFRKDYEIVSEFENDDRCNLAGAYFKGFLMTRAKSEDQP